ncbi:MAG TPA: class II fructose-bisphosphate aldolase [Gemmatimonadales bacterium]|nr:class II fructose-bisphosphate aldolase [Gemmatimonadales bacterium]
MTDVVQQAVDLYGGAVALIPGGVEVKDAARLRSPATDALVWQAVFGEGEEKEAARWLLWELGQATGARPASIHDLYLARGRGECGGFTVPAINVRMMAYDTARAVFRAARAGKAGAIILEIARSEIAYTDQRPAEYVSVLIGAALREGYTLPLFIQGDHCQVNAKKYEANAEQEVGEVKKLIHEEIGAGFYNIDVDTSTLVDLAQPTLDEQQRANYERCAEVTAFIRGLEPEGVTVSVGGEIGEVGHKNSTVEELDAFMAGYLRTLERLGFPAAEGISKISVQTGTSHGGVVLPDGSIADVKIDIDALRDLSRVARERYHLAGAVQHGASTLPANAFGNFPRVETAEIHLATNFQNIVFDHPRLPADLRAEMRAWVSENAAGERKPSDTEEQFFYKARKKAIGPFKQRLWSLPEEIRAAIAADLEKTFAFLFEQLNVNGTADLVDRFIHAPLQHHAALKPALVTAEDDPEAGE